MSSYISVYNKKRLGIADKRAKRIKEVIESIKMIKFNAWEDMIIDEINEYRLKERRLIFIVFMLEGIGSSVSYFLPLLAALICFWIQTQKSEKMSISDTYALILLFNNLIHPILLSLRGIVVRSNSAVSEKRIFDLLQKNEI